MKSVGWVMRLVGGSCPDSGVAVNVTAPVMGPLSCTISVNVSPIAWGLLNVTAARIHVSRSGESEVSRWGTYECHPVCVLACVPRFRVLPQNRASGLIFSCKRVADEL